MQLENTIQEYIDEAIQLNRKNKSCHIALLMQGKKKVISYGINQVDRQYFKGKSVLSLHAEVDCLRKCRNKFASKDIKNYSLVVIKVGKKDDLTYHDSMPCKHCTKFLLGLGFKNIYCSNKDGKIIKIDLDSYIPYNI